MWEGKHALGQASTLEWVNAGVQVNQEGGGRDKHTFMTVNARRG